MTEEDRQQASERSRLLTLLFTDLVDSVGLKSRLGDAEAGRLITAHHDKVRELIELTGGREILVAGDGCFVTFETPSQAVEFALMLQDWHRRNTTMPAVRIGINVGEVTERIHPPDSPRQVDVDGLAVDIASRIQTLALPGQILLSYPVFDNARQRLDSTRWSMPVEWRAHGRYVFQGTDMSLDVYEVGLKGVAPFMPPTGGSKARRDVHDEEESTLGWRPAQGLTLPGRQNWILVEKMGEGGFGDVWMVEHSKTRERNVVKFCYSADRLRALKREVTLFRLLKETLGSRNDIARVLDYQFDTTPYFLEIEYAGNYTLAAWLAERGGAQNVPIDVRLELVAQVATAIAAAHSVGVLHKDIKPSNIMVVESDDGPPQIKMIDFGIGTVEDRDLLNKQGITVTGLTEVESSSDHGTSLTGTRLYMAPELIEGKAATIKSDIYSLGVLLYQMVSGKVGQALAPGWERDVPDPLLREDISACVDGEPENRLTSAEVLAHRLRNIEERRAEIRAQAEREQQDIMRRQRSRRRRIGALLAGGLMLVLLLFAGQFAFMQAEKAAAEEVLRKRAEAAKDHALDEERKTQEALEKAQQMRYYGLIALAEARLSESAAQRAQEVLLEDPPKEMLGREWGWLLAQTAPEDFALRNHNFYNAVFTPDNKEILIGSRDINGIGYIAFYNAKTATRTTEVLTNDRLVWDLDISPDGKLAATASSDNRVTVVDMETKKVRASLRHMGIVRNVAFSPDGKYLASCARDSTLRLWTVEDMRPYSSISLRGDSPTELAFSPDSRYVACGSLEGNVRIFDITTGSEICRLNGEFERVLSLTFLGNGKGIAAASTNNRTFLYHWPPAEGQYRLDPYLQIESKETYPSQVDSSPDGRAIYIGNDNGQVMKVNTSSGAIELDFTVDQPLWKINLDRDGKRMLTTSRWSVRQIDLARMDEESTATPIAVGDVPKNAVSITAAAVFPTRDQTWRQDRVWRTSSGLSLVNTSLGKTFVVKSEFAAYSPTGESYITIDPKTLTWLARSTTSGQRLKSNRKRKCVGAVYSGDGKRAIVMYERGGTIMYNTSDWTAEALFRTESAPACVMFSDDDKKLYLSDISGTIQEYDVTSTTPLRRLRDRGLGSPLAMDMSPDGKLLAVGLDVDKAIIIDLKSGDTMTTMSGHVRYIHGIEFTPDSKRLATLSRDGTAKLWDVETARELVTLFRFSNGVVPLGIRFAPSGRNISAVTSDHRVVTTDVFPWNLNAYGGNSDAPLADRIELWKRKSRLNPSLTMEDMPSDP